MSKTFAFLVLATIILASNAQALPASALLHERQAGPGVTLAKHEFCDGHKMVTGRTGWAIHRDKAEKRARRKWKERVRWLMPWSWGQADWGKARKRSYSCHKKHGVWRCKASAIPCAGWP